MKLLFPYLLEDQPGEEAPYEWPLTDAKRAEY